MGFFSSFHSNNFSTHEGQCGSCAHSTVSNQKLECYCNERRATYKLSEPKCRYYIKDNSRDYDFWREIYTYYILTAIFDILGIDKNNKLYQNIMTLIQLVREDELTTKEAIGYDIFGAEVADKLRQDPNRVEISNYLLTSYLTKIYIAIEMNNQEEAINIYKQMVTELYNRYKGQEELNTILDVDMMSKSKVK